MNETHFFTDEEKERVYDAMMFLRNGEKFRLYKGADVLYLEIDKTLDAIIFRLRMVNDFWVQHIILDEEIRYTTYPFPRMLVSVILDGLERKIRESRKFPL